MTFYSENGEDRWMFESGILPAKGVYVDIGAAWPHRYSNTAMLRDLGWTGIHVDGCADFKPLWDAAGLELLVCVVWTGPEARFAVNPAMQNLSKISEQGEAVPSKTLNEILDGNGIGKFDLLSIDVEGAEHAIVSSLDFERHLPQIIVWEYNTLGAKNEALAGFLESRGYHRGHQTETNYIHFIKP